MKKTIAWGLALLAVNLVVAVVTADAAQKTEKHINVSFIKSDTSKIDPKTGEAPKVLVEKNEADIDGVLRIVSDRANSSGQPEWRDIEVPLKKSTDIKLKLFAYSPEEARKIVLALKKKYILQLTIDPLVLAFRIGTGEGANPIADVEVTLDADVFPKTNPMSLADALDVIASKEANDAEAARRAAEKPVTKIPARTSLSQAAPSTGKPKATH